MHYRFLVTFNKEAAVDSAAARAYVYTSLMDNGFCGERGRWSGGVSDWFVIGGRWSGVLSWWSWGHALYEWMKTEERKAGVQVWGAWYKDAEKTRIQKKLERRFTRRWRTAAPPEFRDIPINRDTYRADGYEDDAMLLTPELYDALLKTYEGQDESEHHADLEYEPVSPTMVGKKWVVVVDYHT